MKRWIFSMLTVSILCLLIYFITGQTNYAFADDNETEFHEQYEKDKEKTEAAEEGGKLLGLGAVAAALSAGVLLPLRRQANLIIKIFPNAKTFFISLLKTLAKWHMLIGVVAFALTLAHGVFMYFSKNELEIREYVGIAATILMGIAAIFGVILSKNKTNSLIRSIHIGLLFTAGAFIVFHVLSA